MLDKKMDFSTGGWLIGGRPTGLLILGDHLFLNCIFFGRRRLINNGMLINPDLTLYIYNVHLMTYIYIYIFIAYEMGRQGAINLEFPKHIVKLQIKMRDSTKNLFHKPRVLL